MNVASSKTDVPPVNLDPMRATAHRPLAEDVKPTRYASRIRQQEISMDITTDVSDAIARAKAPLQRDFPGWNIVHSSADRWWVFLDPNRRGKDAAPARTTAEDLDTCEGLYELLAAAES